MRTNNITEQIRWAGDQIGWWFHLSFLKILIFLKLEYVPIGESCLLELLMAVNLF